MIERSITIPGVKIQLNGILTIPKDAKSIVLFVHGSGSSRLSPRNQYVARYLNKANMATLLFDLLTPEEEQVDNITLELRFDIEFLVSRLLLATEWIQKNSDTKNFKIGYFGASTGGGAALAAAAKKPEWVHSVVSRGGRPDLANHALYQVKAPTLLIIGGNDSIVIELNQKAFKKMGCIKKIEIIEGASHLFEEPGTLDEVARLAKDWFIHYL